MIAPAAVGRNAGVVSSAHRRHERDTSLRRSELVRAAHPADQPIRLTLTPILPTGELVRRWPILPPSVKSSTPHSRLR
jgi:hypothetical protein